MSYKASKSFSQRFGGLIFVVILHVIVVYGLAVALGRDPLAIVKQEIETKIIEDEAPPPEEAPPPPPPDFEPPPPDFVPPPDIAFTADAAPVTNANAITVSRKPVEVVSKTTPPRQPKKGLSRPPYPAASLRLGEEGAVGLSLTLNETGKVQEATVDSSSGFERLDEAAVKHAIRSWKFEPCMNGDKPVACTYRMKFRFKISEAK